MRFHDRNPWVYAGIVAHAHELLRQGFRSVGVRYLYEHQRYSAEARQHRRARSGLEFGLNNDFAAWYGRLIEASEPDLRGFFRLRRTRAEQEAADPSQTRMEFD